MFSRGNGRTKDGKKVRDRNNAVIVTRDFQKLWLGGMFVCHVDSVYQFLFVGLSTFAGCTACRINNQYIF